ncbi:hypothetical protein T492DRAFT_543790 [Pavlovales sp. CCMP2436]|nr:hypothetical protein T492DRAFT_543790 [Pavlovales sp. CCMP2436]
MNRTQAEAHWRASVALRESRVARERRVSAQFSQLAYSKRVELLTAQLQSLPPNSRAAAILARLEAMRHGQVILSLKSLPFACFIRSTLCLNLHARNNYITRMKSRQEPHPGDCDRIAPKTVSPLTQTVLPLNLTTTLWSSASLSGTDTELKTYTPTNNSGSGGPSGKRSCRRRNGTRSPLRSTPSSASGRRCRVHPAGTAL